MDHLRPGRERADAGAIVLGLLTKLAIVVGLLGLLGYDVVSVIGANFSVADRADKYASEAADLYHSSKDVNQAYATVSAEAADKGDRIPPDAFTIDADGKVHLTLHHQASSLWMHRIGALKDLLDTKSSGEGFPPS